MYLRFELFGLYFQFQTGEVDEEQEVEESLEEPTPEPSNAGHPLIEYNQDYIDPVGFHMPPETAY